MPSQIHARCVKGPGEIIRHMRSAFARKLPTLAKVDEHDGEAVLCGSGPSLADHVDDIRKLKESGRLVIAIKGAHDFLIERGVIPHIALAVDPQEKIAMLYRKPQRGVRYYMSTQCHPAVFDALTGHHVVTWNVYTKSVKEYWDKYFRKKQRSNSIFFVNGGSTSGLRCIGVAWVMGYRKLHLYGFDSSLRLPPEAYEDGKVNQEKAREGLLKVTGEKNTKDLAVINADGREFYCDPAMALQANEFLHQIQKMGDVRIKAYGDGLIPFIAERAALRGLEQCRFPDEDWIAPSPLRGTVERITEEAA